MMQNTCDSVYKVKCEHKTQPAYIAFEVVSAEDHLNELTGKQKKRREVQCAHQSTH